MERKFKSAIGRKSEAADGIADFLSGTKCALFQASGNIPLERDKFNNVAKRCPMTGKDLAMTLWGILSSPFACYEKWATARTTSENETSRKVKPSTLASDRMSSRSASCSVGETETPAKCVFNSLGVKPCSCSAAFDMMPRLRSSFHTFLLFSRASNNLFWMKVSFAISERCSASVASD